jgi:hypothetical protein
MTCSATTTPEATEDATAIVLDDMDTGSVYKSSYAFEGLGLSACMKDAYNGQFHHDWSRNKGKAQFTFKFEPPKDGCYMIEEYHPGSNDSCSQYLPSNARLEVGACKSKKTSFYINQAKNGGQWNNWIAAVQRGEKSKTNDEQLAR